MSLHNWKEHQRGDDAISDRTLFRLVTIASAVWLGSAVLFFSYHRLGLPVTLGCLAGGLLLLAGFKYRLLSLGPFEERFDEFMRARRMARLRRLARQEQIATDPINNEILYIQQFASPGLMAMLTGEEFLDVVVRYFRLQGYARRYQRVECGGPTDAILRKGKDWYLLRCLRLDTEAELVDERVVRAMAEVMDENLCLLGILVTNGRFTPRAEIAAAELDITLLDGVTLAGSMQAFQLRAPTVPWQPNRPRRSA